MANFAGLYNNNDGTATGRFEGNPFVDLRAQPVDEDCIELHFVDVLTGSVLKKLKCKSVLNPRTNKIEYAAEGEPWVIVQSPKGKTKLGVIRRVMGGDDGASGGAHSLFS